MNDHSDKEKINKPIAEATEKSGVTHHQKENSPGVEPYNANANDPEKQLAEVKEKLNQSENQYIRLLADYQNLQKRTAQERDELHKYAAQKTLEILLPALDTFDYAKSTIKPDSNPEKVIEDLTLVFEMLLKCLKDIGLATIEETGVPFNPFHHEPLHQIPTDELPDQTVIQILKKGYVLNNKVIRPALVSVSVKQKKEEE